MQYDLFGNEIKESRPKSREQEYQEYISSPKWRRIAKAAIERAGGQCQKCGISKWTKKLEVHHVTYERFKNERPEDLMVLCPDCHKEEDKKRQAGTRRRNLQALGDARFYGWCRAVYGEHRMDTIDMVDAYDKYIEWLDRKGY